MISEHSRCFAVLPVRSFSFSVPVGPRETDCYTVKDKDLNTELLKMRSLRSGPAKSSSPELYHGWNLQ